MATILAIVIHAAALLGDSYLHPSVLDLTIPFVSSSKTAWMSIGIVAGWSMVLLGLSYYLRAQIGQERWRILHRFTALAWVLGSSTRWGRAPTPARAGSWPSPR